MRGSTTLAERTFGSRFLEMLGREEPPELVAASFALGVAISFTPLFGFHWILALFLAFVLRLNKVDVMLGTFVINPLTIGPVSAVAIPVGRFLLRTERQAAAHLPWREVMTRSFWSQVGPRMRAVGLQWGVGMLVLAAVSGALTYVSLVALLKWKRARTAAAAGGAPVNVDDTAPPSPS